MTMKYGQLLLALMEKTLATGCDDHKARLWDVIAGKCIKVFQGHTNEIHSVKFNLEGQNLISSSKDGTIRFWDIKTEKCKRILEGHRRGTFN